MQLDLGTKIRQLRRRDGRTQEALADALGVTPQAVSRWESGGSYPDMNLIPPIANYFGVTIDELFGYTNERDKKVDILVSRICEMNRQNNGVDRNMDECIALAREAMAEFPGNEKITLCLASILYTAGYVRYGEHHLTDEDGYSIYDAERHRSYPEWREAVSLYENALSSLENSPPRYEAVAALSQLYLNLGEHDKALALAESAPDIWESRDFLRIYAFDGKQQVQAYGEALLKTVHSCAALIIQCVMAYGQNMTAPEKEQSISGAIKLFDHVCPDGNYGRYHAFVSRMNMLLSVYLWQNGKHDEAFDALNQALTHFQKYEKMRSSGRFSYTAPLVRLIKDKLPGTYVPDPADTAASLPEDWPWWSVPEKDAVQKEMRSDPRWNAWVAKTRG